MKDTMRLDTPTGSIWVPVDTASMLNVSFPSAPSMAQGAGQVPQAQFQQAQFQQMAPAQQAQNGHMQRA